MVWKTHYNIQSDISKCYVRKISLHYCSRLWMNEIQIQHEINVIIPWFNSVFCHSLKSVSNMKNHMSHLMYSELSRNICAAFAYRIWVRPLTSDTVLNSEDIVTINLKVFLWIYNNGIHYVVIFLWQSLHCNNYRMVVSGDCEIPATGVPVRYTSFRCHMSSGRS